jgi:TonB family protein
MLPEASMRILVCLLCCLWPGFPAAAQAAADTVLVQAEAPGLPVAAAPVPWEFAHLVARFRPPAPAYPPLARLANVQGTVLLRLTIGVNGGVERAQALEGPALLRGAAEAFLGSWTFQPVLIDGQPARVQCDLQVPFHLTDVPAPEAGTVPSKVILQVIQKPMDGAATMPPEQLQAEIQALLDRSGLRQVTDSEAGPRDTFHVKLEIQTVRVGADLYLCQTQERCSLWADRDLVANEPGQPQRIGFVGHVVGQKGEGEFQEMLRATVRRTLAELLVIPPRPAPPKTAQGPVAVTAPKPPPAAPAGKAVDFDFSQIRIKYQPPAPRYPPYAKTHHVQGTVVVELTIDPEGLVSRAEALEGPGPLLLTAIGYALDWKFQPALLNGVPQYARFRLTMPFRLR